ncbi:MAG: LytR C-terminal domain-containing protein [Ignavibacteriales bacterium]
MKKIALRAALLSATLMLPGCATVHHYLAWLHPHRQTLTIKPFQTPSAVAQEGAADRAYRAAVAAIDARDYGLALDRLQLARQEAPNDVRVLNAMAVIYDKLGRFDLSTRFYAEAEQAAPGSPIVEANLAYSKTLQGQYQAMRSSPVVEAAVTPRSADLKPMPQLVAEAAPAPTPMLKVATPLLVGRPLMVVDAAGVLEKAESVRTQLAGRGWSVMAEIKRGEPSKESRILYPAENRQVALALANTLPFAATLTVCQGDCRGLTLILGENARWAG